VLLVTWTFGLLQLALFARVISSWFQMSPYSPWIRWSFVLTEWFLAPLRRVIPSFGMIDLTPIVAYFGLQLLEAVLIRGI
jgi:YggT family protein